MLEHRSEPSNDLARPLIFTHDVRQNFFDLGEIGRFLLD
jgi:hypothetical protein